MIEQVNFHIINFVFLLAGFVPLFLSIYVLKLKTSTINRFFSGLMMACFIYSLGNALEMFAVSLAWKIVFLKVEYFGAVFLGPLMFMFAIHYTGNEGKISKKFFTFVFLVSFALLGLVLSNTIHGLFYSSFTLEFNGLYHHVASGKGVFYWVHQAYTLMLLLVSLGLLIKMAREVPPKVSPQVYMVVFGLSSPLFIYIWYLTGTVPYRLDIIPFGFVIAGVFIFFGLVKFKLFQIAPVAYKTLFDNMEDGVIVTDLDHQLVTCNLSAKRLLVGEKKMTLDSIQENWPEVAGLISSDLDFDIKEFNKLLHDRMGWFLVSKSGVRDSKSNKVGNIIILRDITQEKNYRIEIEKAREAAEKANQAKSEFLANMSHEIRTPLNGVIGFTELLSNTQLSEQQQRYATTALHSANALLDLINDILDLAKIEAGKTELAYQETDLYGLLETVIEVLSFQAHQKGLELLLDIGEGVPKAVMVDDLKLKQVLINLLNNALKFTAKGEVILKVSRFEIGNGDEAHLRFSVKDTGIGIEEEKQALIFEAFSQADSSTTKKFGGTGLGLTISSKLLSLMESRLRLDSKEGKGSTFYFDLMLPTTNIEVDKPEIFPSLSKVMVIDENYNSRQIIEEYCNRFSVDTACTGSFSQALAWMEEEGDVFKVVMLNHNVLRMNSYTGVERLMDLAGGKGQGFHFVAMVGSNDGEEIITRYQETCDGFFLNKPVTLQKLGTLFNSLSSKKEPSRLRDKTAFGKRDRKTGVLLAGEDAVTRMLVKIYMDRLYPEVEVIEVDNGRKAIELFQSKVPAVVLTDIHMSGVDGFELCKMIRSLPGGKDVPIIGLSANIMKRGIESGYQAGFNDYLTKPVFYETFKVVMDRWLTKKSHSQER